MTTIFVLIMHNYANLSILQIPICGIILSKFIKINQNYAVANCLIDSSKYSGQANSTSTIIENSTIASTSVFILRFHYNMGLRVAISNQCTSTR